MAKPELPFPLDVPVPETFADAMKSLRDPAYAASQNWQDQQWRAVRLGAHSDIKEFERRFIKRCYKLGIPLFAHSMVRTREDQDKLFADGVSDAKGGQSAHNYGMAVDIVHGVRAWGLKPKEWLMIGHVGREVAASAGIDITWGGHWKIDPETGVGWDPAHWELTLWRRLVDGFPFPSEG